MLATSSQDTVDYGTQKRVSAPTCVTTKDQDDLICSLNRAVVGPVVLEVMAQVADDGVAQGV